MADSVFTAATGCAPLDPVPLLKGQAGDSAGVGGMAAGAAEAAGDMAAARAAPHAALAGGQGSEVSSKRRRSTGQPDAGIGFGSPDIQPALTGCTVS